MSEEQQDIDEFSEWLKRRNKQPFSHEFIVNTREILQNNTSLFAVNEYIRSLGIAEYMDERWKLSCLLKNMEFPFISEQNHLLLMNAFKIFLNSRAQNTCYTYEAILAILCSQLGLKLATRKMECPICFIDLEWHEKVLKCGHVFHFHCATSLDKCPVCVDSQE